tara:strand:- start:176 stop:964 length:789 start_codon:yes stop_codon:yes gene_type:complete
MRENFKDLVSIIMNCHNGEKYLKQSINSIISQTYSNWELIFWDNLSKDESKNIVKDFDDRRIKYHSSKNFLKLYDARNHAIKKATGKYITFLDTDDYWIKEKLEKQVNFIKKNKKYKLIYSNFLILDEIKNTKKKLSEYLPSGFITKKLLDNYRLGILSVFLDKEIFENYSFNKDYEIIGDFDFFINLSKNYEFGCINEPLAVYRLHESNFSKKKVNIHASEISDWLKVNNDKLKKQGYNTFNIKFLLFKLKLKSFLNFLGM